MDIKVYEDQTGLMLPDKKIKDEKIVTFFNNDIELYIEKMKNEMKIYCSILARKEFERYLGYFITYEGNFEDNTFTRFKEDAERILKDLGLRRRTGNQDNILFDNIEFFDSKGYTDISQISQALNHKEHLGYRSGNTKEIANFCKDIMTNIDNIKISISSLDNRLGNINIYINKKYQESLLPTDDTKQIFSRYRHMAIENKRTEDMRRAKEKIKEACYQIKGEMDILEAAGYEITDTFIEDSKKIINDILTSRVKKIEKKDMTKIPGEKKMMNTKKKTGTRLVYIILAIGIITSLLIVLSPYFGIDIRGMLYGKDTGGSMSAIIPNETIIPITTPEIPYVGGNVAQDQATILTTTHINDTTTPPPLTAT